jgi:hypothetical protein
MWCFLSGLIPIITAIDFSSSLKPHGELEPSLEKLEGLKLNRQYGDLIECIDSAIAFIKDPSHSLSSHAAFTDHLTCQLFTESYLLHHVT